MGKEGNIQLPVGLAKTEACFIRLGYSKSLEQLLGDKVLSLFKTENIIILPPYLVMCALLWPWLLLDMVIKLIGTRSKLYLPEEQNLFTEKSQEVGWMFHWYCVLLQECFLKFRKFGVFSRSGFFFSKWGKEEEEPYYQETSHEEWKMNPLTFSSSKWVYAVQLRFTASTPLRWRFFVYSVFFQPNILISPSFQRIDRGYLI